jgi:hypothetical protein
MNQDEKKILNGIYRNYEVIDDSIPYDAAELNWLLENKLDKANEWRDNNGKFKSIGTKKTKGEDWLSQISKINYKIKKALSYLKGKQYIDYTKNGYSFKISITSSGCEVARKLQTRRGRIDLWYQDKKDGIIWLLITTLTAAVVTVITNLIIEKFK